MVWNPLNALVHGTTAQGKAVNANAMTSDYNPFAHQYDMLGNQVTQNMQQRALGQGGPSLAEMQQAQGIQQAQQAAMAAGAGSTNPAMARRMAIQQSGQLAGQAAMAGGQLRAQEQQQNQQQYAQMLQAQAQQQAQANQMAGNISMGNVQGQNQMAAENMQGQNQMAMANMQAKNQRSGQILGGVMNGAGSGMATLFSDKRLKHDIDEKRGGKGIEKFLSAMRPARYEYDNPDHGRGPQYGIMAQDAASTEVGRSFVHQRPEGLALDTSRAVGPILAALAHLNAKIEGGR